MNNRKKIIQPREGEYHKTEVAEMTGFWSGKICDLGRAGKFVKTTNGYYTKESVDAYIADMAERRKIKPAIWLAGDGGTVGR